MSEPHGEGSSCWWCSHVTERDDARALLATAVWERDEHKAHAGRLFIELALEREKMEQLQTMLDGVSIVELFALREENKALRVVLAEHGWFGRDA
jgi:hypothetical protein